MKVRGSSDGISWSAYPAGLIVVDEAALTIRSRIGPVTNTFAKVLVEDSRIRFQSHLSITKAKVVAYSVSTKRPCRIHDAVTCAALFFDTVSPNADPEVLFEDSFCRLHGFTAGEVMNYAFSMKTQ